MLSRVSAKAFLVLLTESFNFSINVGSGLPKSVIMTMRSCLQPKIVTDGDGGRREARYRLVVAGRALCRRRMNAHRAGLNRMYTVRMLAEIVPWWPLRTSPERNTVEPRNTGVRVDRMKRKSNVHFDGGEADLAGLYGGF